MRIPDYVSLMSYDRELALASTPAVWQEGIPLAALRPPIGGTIRCRIYAKNDEAAEMEKWRYKVSHLLRHSEKRLSA